MNEGYSFRKLILYFLKLGATGFGGSIALAHAMHRDLVVNKKWLTDEQFRTGLTLSQIAPGPLAAQLAIYIGFVKAGVKGASGSAIAFVLPSFVMVAAISVFYSHFEKLSILQAILYGIGASVIGIIASSGYRLTRQTMQRKKLLWIIYLSVFLATILTKSTNVLLYLLGGITAMLVYTKEQISIPKNWLVIPLIITTSPLTAFVLNNRLLKLFLFFLTAGTIAFGGGLAIVPYLQDGAVHNYHWLTEKQFVDAVAVAMITPGPVVIASTFIGYLTAGFFGALVATVAIFLPVYLIVIFLTPFFIKHAKHPRMVAFIEGVLASAMASIAGSVLLLGEHSVTSIATFLLAVTSFLLAHKTRVPAVVIILFAGILGIFFYKT
jgi:chromate transporter